MNRYSSTAPAPANNGYIEEQADSTGAVYANNEGRKATYRSTTSGVVVTANGVLLQIIGSATKTVRISRIACNGILTTAAMVLVQVQRTTAAASSVSNAVAVTPRLLDTTSAAATAVATSYTAATLGTGNTLLASARAFYQPATALSTGVEFLFGGPQRPIADPSWHIGMGAGDGSSVVLYRRAVRYRRGIYRGITASRTVEARDRTSPALPAQDYSHAGSVMSARTATLRRTR